MKKTIIAICLLAAGQAMAGETAGLAWNAKGYFAMQGLDVTAIADS